MMIAVTQLSVVLVFASLLWLVSLKVGKVSIVDSCWSIFFMVACAVAFVLARGVIINVCLVALPLLLWGSRLSLHILIRGAKQGEDPRYLRLQQHYGHNRKAWALWVVFWPQAVLACVINAPLTVAIVHKDPPWSYAFVVVGIIVFMIGFLFESIADAQLSKFQKSRRDNQQVLDKGLWAWSRHPNYFGEAVLWWGFYILSVGVSGHVITIFSPVLMTFLLLRVSGVTMLDSLLKTTKPRYESYMKNTSAFFPWPPKK